MELVVRLLIILTVLSRQNFIVGLFTKNSGRCNVVCNYDADL